MMHNMTALPLHALSRLQTTLTLNTLTAHPKPCIEHTHTRTHTIGTPGWLRRACIASEQQLAQMEALFERADLDSSGELDFDEFTQFISSLKGPMATTLLASREAGLRRLIGLHLDVGGLSLARELGIVHASRRGRAELSEMESSVARWCALVERTEATGLDLDLDSDSSAEPQQTQRTQRTQRSQRDVAGEPSLEQLETLAADAGALSAEILGLDSKWKVNGWGVWAYWVYWARNGR